MLHIILLDYCIIILDSQSYLQGSQFLQFQIKFKMQQIKPRRVLPPGIEEDIVFGIIWIRVGVYKTIKPSTSSQKVIIQFWGEPSSAILYTSQAIPSTVEYDIKCPITFFEKYLLDMKKNLKIQVENIGHVTIDLSQYLKKNITITNKTPFEHFKGFFEVIGKNNKKVGSIQLQMCANFNPQIALQQLHDQQEQSQQNVCLVSTQKNCKKCNGICKCKKEKINAVDVLAVQKPELFREFYEEVKTKTSPPKPISIVPITAIDNRIPNSLNIVPNNGVFDPYRYSQPDPSTPKVAQHFPTVQKILTYSNLRIKKQQTNKDSSRPISIKQHISQPISEAKLKQLPPESRAQISKQDTQKPTLIQKPTAYFKQTEKQPNPNFQRKKSQLQPPFQQQLRGNIPLSDVSEVEKVDESVSVQAEHDILSKVINLTQLEKKKNSPKKNMEREKIYEERKYQEQFVQHNLPLFPPPNFLATKNIPQNKKHSSLLLNMILEIPIFSVSFPKSTKFNVCYRPYGQKQSIRCGPQFPQTLIIMFPVGQQQILKMNKIPLILQFWGCTDSQLLGIIKLNLSKIHKGFILDGKLNELAIKTSLLPTVIHKGNISLMSLNEKSVGECWLSAHIGTSGQIQSYLNSPTTHRKEDQKGKIAQEIAKKQQEMPKEQEKIHKPGKMQDFIAFLQLIDSNSSPTILQNLLNFMNLTQATHSQFQELLNKLLFKGSDFFPLIAENGTLKCKQLSSCFDDYKFIKQAHQKSSSSVLRQISKEEQQRFIDAIKEKSSFGIISKSDLSGIFNQPIFSSFLSFIEDIVESQNIIDWLKTFGKIYLKKIIVSEQSSSGFIEDIFIKECPKYIQIMQKLLSDKQKNSEISLFELKGNFLRENKRPFSIWFWRQLASLTYKSFAQSAPTSDLINTSIFYNFLALKKRASLSAENSPSQILQPSSDNIIQPSQPRQKQHSSDSLSQKQIINNIPETKNPSKQEKQPKIPLIDKQPQSIDKQNSADKIIHHPIPKQPQKPQSPSLIQHKFIISLEQLHLQQQLSGQCHISYQFPFQQQSISSRKLQLILGKHKYKLVCCGTHKFTLQQPLNQYLGQSTVSFRVSIAKQQQFFGDLHSEELVTKGLQYRVIPLFSATQQGMVGKIKLKIQYSQEAGSQLALGRETIKDVFLPKNGFINFSLSTPVDQARLRTQFNLKQQFYLQISFDIFGENSALAPHFPPFYSKLYSDFSSQLTVCGSFKIALNPQILQHLRGGSVDCRLTAVYYAKQKGSYERKDLLVASFKAPLFSVIRQQGLQGDYAFKNRLGMFVSLAKCSIKYEKTSKQEYQGQNLDPSARQNYWILLDFSQLINFQGDLGWLKFQIISKGKRYSTQKTLIRQLGSYQLDQRYILLQMGEQQFSITKILPISLNIGSERCSIDVNIRPIAKVLGKQKIFCCSQYFMVVDQQSRARKMRAGVKVVAVRGHASVAPFIEGLARNCIRSQTEEKEENYQQNLQNLRRNLKMSGKSFEDALGQLLDRRKKQKLPSNFFTSKIHSSLDLSPIFAPDQSDVILLVEQLPSQIDSRSLLEHLQATGLKLTNLRSQYLDRYTFNKLNFTHLDQNVEYLGLGSEIDLLVFAQKLRIHEQQQPSQLPEREKPSNTHKMVRVSIGRGYNFHLLYNGIKPNARVVLPDLGLQTDAVQRSSQPVFNEHINMQLRGTDLRKIKIEVYHQASEEIEAILIGEGTLNISQAFSSNQSPYSKVFRAVINSSMSNRMQAALDIKVQINQRQEPQEKSFSEMEESIGDSRVEQAMERINKLTDYKRKAALFESSDEEY